MKKLFALCLCALLLAAPFARAEIDLSGMSLDELLSLRDRVTLAMWNTDEWQEVTVPAGVYEVGKEIPAGKWTIYPLDGGMAVVTIGDRLETGGGDISYHSSYYASEYIASESARLADTFQVRYVTYTLIDGSYIAISDAPVIFKPFSGHDLGFK